MSTFAEFIVKCEDRVNNKNLRTTPFIKQATVSWLKSLSHKRTLMMEDSFSFSTVAGQAEYDSTAVGFPPAAMEFDTVYVQIGSGVNAQNILIPGPAPIAVIREEFGPYEEGEVLAAWAWHHQKLIFAPVPRTVVTIKGDYFKDATRDTATGDLITDASTTHTNPWFDRGETALMNAVLYNYHLTLAKDAEAAQMALGLFQAELETLENEWHMKKLRGVQAAWTFGGA